MGKYFSDIHASYIDELVTGKTNIEDSEEVREARGRDLVTLGKALSFQLRYNEAISCCTKILMDDPDNLEVLRLRAGKYLSTLKLSEAVADFEKCLTLGGDLLDINYRLGICFYLMKEYELSRKRLENAFKQADDEMGIAIMFWHTLSSLRSKKEASLLNFYHEGMKVGHHTAYEKAISVLSGKNVLSEALKELEEEKDDLEFSIAAYGISEYLRSLGKNKKANELAEEILKRDSFWISFAFLACFNDRRQSDGRT